MSAAHCCAYCSRWFVGKDYVSGLVSGVLSLDSKAISHGICPECYIVQTAPFRPSTLAGWLAESRTTAADILGAWSPVQPQPIS